VGVIKQVFISDSVHIHAKISVQGVSINQIHVDLWQRSLVCKQDESRFRAAETKFMRKAEAGRTPLDYRKNLDTVKEGTEYTTYTGIHRKLQKEQLHRMSAQ
jgi:hypothetical protein